jgi:hypothetical protein
MAGALSRCHVRLSHLLSGRSCIVMHLLFATVISARIRTLMVNARRLLLRQNRFLISDLQKIVKIAQTNY